MNEGKDKDKIVPSTPNSLDMRKRGLVRRGLQDLSRSEPRRKRILISHEEAVNEVLEGELRSAGYETKVASHSSQVLELVEAFWPDVVLIQLIAEVDALKLSEQLARGFPRVKIVILGPLVGEELKVKQYLQKKGITCSFLELPFDRKEQLLDVLESQFG
jgi:DNA-binding NtrC family response regulator